MAVKNKFSPFMKQCFVTTAMGLNGVCFGAVIGFPAILLPQLKHDDSSVRLTKDDESWIAAILPLSVLAGNFVTPPIMDRLGRKMTHYAVILVFFIGWYITILANSFQTLLIGRICQGLAGGLLSILRCALIGEYSSPKNRGAFLTTIAFTQAFGIFFVHLVGSLISWQKTALICVFLPFISLLMVIYTPESPSWLVTKGKFNECREVFRWLRGDEEEEELEDMIHARMTYDRAKIMEPKRRNWFGNLLTTIRKREFYKPIILMVHSNALMHLSGASTFAPYATMIIGLLMGANANANFWMVFLDTQRILSNGVAVYVINKVGRRPIVLYTGILSIASHFTIALYLYLKLSGLSFEGVWLPAVLINFQFLAVAVGMVPMPQVIGGEIFPLEYRSSGGTISVAIGGMIMFVLLKTYPNLIDAMGLHGAYVVYGVLIIANLGVMMAWLPETRGKTLQQIEDELRGRPLKLEEVQERESMQSNPVLIYKRKLSERRCSSPAVVI